MDEGTERYEVLLEAVNQRSTLAVYNYYSEVAGPVIVLKGWSVSRFYGADRRRVYTDVDLAVDPGFREVFLNASKGFPIKGIAVDLHFGLRHLDTLPWSELIGRTELVELEGTQIRVLAEEDNLRVAAVHWLTDGGINKDRLWDIFYLVKNRKKDFDWRRCLESNGSTRKTWVMAAIATARDHLSLDLSGLPEEVRQFRLPNWYKAALEKEWSRGVYSRRVLASVITQPKLLLQQLRRRFPPNKIAATIDSETAIDESWRFPAQVKSLTKKIVPFARGVGRRLT